MKRIAIITALVMAVTINTSAGVRVTDAAKHKTAPAPRVTCWVASIGWAASSIADPKSEFQANQVGCFRTKKAALEECSWHPQMQCAVYGLIKPHNHKAGGGK